MAQSKTKKSIPIFGEISLLPIIGGISRTDHNRTTNDYFVNYGHKKKTVFSYLFLFRQNLFLKMLQLLLEIVHYELIKKVFKNLKFVFVTLNFRNRKLCKNPHRLQNISESKISSVQNKNLQIEKNKSPILEPRHQKILNQRVTKKVPYNHPFSEKFSGPCTL